MGQAVGEVLPFAVGVAVVPIPVIAMIAMLFSSRAHVNGPAFLVGWVAGLSAAFVLVYLVTGASDPDTDETASDAVGWVRIVLGALLLRLAWRTWRKRPPAGAEPELPGWMAGVDQLRPGKALGLGTVLAALNPKNLVLIVGAAAGVASLGVSGRDAATGLVAFVVVGSLTVAAPLVYSLVGGERARASLDEVKGWLGTHNDAIIAVLFLVFGAVLVANGLAPLTD